MKIYFNPSCSKCRNAVAQLDNKQSEYEVVRYLEHKLSDQELHELMDTLVDPIRDLVRKDKKFEELGLNEDDYTNKDAVFALLSKHPELMQRPVITKDGKSHIARTPQKVDELA